MLFKLAGEIMIDDKPAVKSLDNVEGRAKKSEGRLGKIFKGIGKGAGMLAGAFTVVGGAGIGMANKFSNTADEIHKSAMKMGVGTDELQELRYAMEQVGVDSGGMDRALGRLNQRMGRASQGNEKYQDALEGVGVSMEDVRNGTVSTDEAFMTAIDTLNGMEDSQKQSAMASELFGTKMARDLMPAIEEGTLSIEELRKEAQETGGVIGEDSVDAGVLWADTMDKLKFTASGVFNQLAGELLPAFQGFLDWVLENMPTIQATFQRVFDVISFLMGNAINLLGKLIEWGRNWYNENKETLKGIKDTFLETITEIIAFVKEWYQENEETIKAIGQTIKDFVVLAKELIGAFIDWGMKVWEDYGEDIVRTLKVAWDIITDTISTAVSLIQDIIDVFIAIFTGDWERFWNAIGRILDTALTYANDLIEKALDLMQNLVWIGLNAVLDVFNSIMDAINNLVERVFDWIVGNITDSLSEARDVASNILGKITGGFRNFRDNITDFVGTIKNNVKGAFETVTSAGETMRRKLVSAFKKLRSGIKAPLNGVIGFQNSIVSGFEKLINGLGSAVNKIPSFEIPSWVPGIGGNSFGLPNIGNVNLSRFNIPGLAEGGNVVRGGATLVGEEGPEILDLPRGSAVTPLEKQGETNNFNIAKLVVREEADVKKVARELDRLKESRRRPKGGTA